MSIKIFLIIKLRLFDPLELMIGKIKNEKHMFREGPAKEEVPRQIA